MFTSQNQGERTPYIRPGKVPAELIKQMRGFTLVELLITVVVVAILTAIAYPSFAEYLRKSRRSDAVTGLAAIQHAQERWRTNNPSYTNTLSAIYTAPASNVYNFSLSGVTANGYTATATPKNPGPQSGDASCTTMSVVVTNGNVSYTATGTGAATCWNR